MKTIKSAIIGAVALSFASAIHTWALEGLQISVQSSNVVLSWPSATNETYLVQYRPTLDASSAWTTLTDSYPAAIGTNMTCFVHSNIVQFPLIMGGGTNTGMGARSTSSRMSGLAATTATAPLVPMVKPANGSGGTVPLALYPPGSPLTGLLIYDPSTGKWISGNGYAVAPTTTPAGGAQPMDAGSGDTNQYTGFYRVVRDGVHIYGLTNGMVLGGTVQFPIEFALDSTDQIVGVSFYDTNDNPIIGASGQSPGSNVWQMVWNTPMSFNGDDTVVAEIDFAGDNPAVSVPVTVTVSNVISFPNYFSQVFGSQMWIFAQTIPNAAYQIDMYDENTNYLGPFTGSADGNGYISFIWDLTDTNGYTLDDTNFYGVFTVDTSSLSSMSQSMGTKSLNSGLADFQTASLVKKTLGSKIKPSGPVPAGNSSNASATQFWAKEFGWTPNNNWVVAYASLTGDSQVDQSAKWMIAGGAGSPTEDYGVLGTLDPYGLNQNLSPGNNAQNGDVFTVSDATSRSNLLSYLADQRYENFYFFGHGNETSISAYKGSHTLITDEDIAKALDNGFMFYFTIPPKPANFHPYRFIWIDACDTAKGNFCEAFAIPAMTVSTNFFAAAGVESRAFLGFAKPTGFDPSNSSADVNSWPNRSTMIAEFLNAWLSGQYDLNTIVQNAKNSFGNYGYRMDSSAVIYGAYDLKRFTLTRPPQ